MHIHFVCILDMPINFLYYAVFHTPHNFHYCNNFHAGYHHLAVIKLAPGNDNLLLTCNLFL